MTKYEMEGYLCGMIDGEGSLNLSNRKYITVGGKEREYIYLDISISNKNLECLEVIADYLGFGKIRYKRTSKIFILQFNEKESISLLDLIGEKLIVKREEVNLIKRFINEKSNLHLIQLRELRRGYNPS